MSAKHKKLAGKRHRLTRTQAQDVIDMANLLASSNLIDDDLPTVETVNHPPHYNSHPSGVECIDVTEHMNFNCGNAVKYIWRCEEKGSHIEDLKKAQWYIEREIFRRKKQQDAQLGRIVDEALAEVVRINTPPKSWQLLRGEKRIKIKVKRKSRRK